MEKELNPDVIKATQSSLGKYVKRPPLTDKLLRKPPFRFLHDIVTTVMKTTGFFEGLFEDGELVSENVKDRDSKISFLNKVISVLNMTTGKTLAAKPSKIVAGQEPENTNELLQCIAFALDNKLSSNDAVQNYKEEDKSKSDNKTEKFNDTTKNAKKANDTKKSISKSSEKLTSNKKEATSEKFLTRNDKEKINISKSKQKETTVIKKDSPPKKISTQPKTLSKKNSVEKPSHSKNDPPNRATRKTLNEDSVARNEELPKEPTENDINIQQESVLSDEKPVMTDTISSSKPSSPKVDQGEQVKLNSSYTIVENDLNSSLSSQDLMEIDHGNAEENQNLLIENSEIISENKLSRDYSNNESTQKSENSFHENTSKSNNKAPSPVKYIVRESYQIDNNTPKSNNVEIAQNALRPKSVRPSSSRPGAPRLREKHDNIVIGNENLLMGKVNIIVENTPNEEEEDSSFIIMDQQANAPTISEDKRDMQLSSNQQHGALVQQILDSQKEYSQTAGKTEIEWQFGAKKAREAVNQEVEQLRFNIQALSRVANPLGKVLDHIQEDVEVMRQELQQWTKTYDEASKELLKQKTANEDSLFPLHAKLKQLDADIVEKHDKINDLKIIIHKNSLRIEKLLAGGNVQ